MTQNLSSAAVMIGALRVKKKMTDNLNKVTRKKTISWKEICQIFEIPDL